MSCRGYIFRRSPWRRRRGVLLEFVSDIWWCISSFHLLRTISPDIQVFECCSHATPVEMQWNNGFQSKLVSRSVFCLSLSLSSLSLSLFHDHFVRFFSLSFVSFLSILTIFSLLSVLCLFHSVSLYYSLFSLPWFMLSFSLIDLHLLPLLTHSSSDLLFLFPGFDRFYCRFPCYSLFTRRVQTFTVTATGRIMKRHLPSSLQPKTRNSTAWLSLLFLHHLQ